MQPSHPPKKILSASRFSSGYLTLNNEIGLLNEFNPDLELISPSNYLATVSPMH